VTTHLPRHDLGELVRTAHADAWQAEGRLREPHGGGVCAVRGARAMASGIRTPKWNNADVIHEQVDLEALSAWYESRGMPLGGCSSPVATESDAAGRLAECPTAPNNG
jgi:hypothetical protein